MGGHGRGAVDDGTIHLSGTAELTVMDRTNDLAGRLVNAYLRIPGPQKLITSQSHQHRPLQTPLGTSRPQPRQTSSDLTRHH